MQATVEGYTCVCQYKLTAVLTGAALHCGLPGRDARPHVHDYSRETGARINAINHTNTPSRGTYGYVTSAYAASEMHLTH